MLHQYTRQKYQFTRWTNFVLCGLLCFLTATEVATATELHSHIAVVYPEIGEPYRNVFTKIIEGIEDQVSSRVSSFAIGANNNPQDLSAELRRQDIRIVITLGRQGLKVANAVANTAATTAANSARDIGIIAGGVLSVPEAEARDFSISSLAPDPTLLFNRLKSLAPNIKRVFVVYDPRQNDWLIRLAKEATASRGLELVTYEARDLKSALRIYQEIILASDVRKDALWLPQDSTTVEETSVLPLVLQESWNRNMLIFSSNVTHVKRGALFSLYPDNFELGRSLGGLALRQIASGSYRTNTGMAALKDVLFAVNIRTASHLGLNVESKRQSFDLIFPEP